MNRNNLGKAHFIFLLIGFTLILTAFSPQNQNIKILEKNGVRYLSNTVVIKLKDSPVVNTNKSVFLSQEIAATLERFGFNQANVLLPEKTINSFLSAAKEGPSLGRIVVATYDSDADPFFVTSKIKGAAGIEWVEPKFVYELDYTPDDPSFASQFALNKISAALAWDVNKGDTNIIIGIVDTGVDWDHPDLAANIWRNQNEIPNNGIDDDNNGYVDDIRGWDFGGLTGTPDNSPMEDRPDHGTHVAGIASAVTDNGIGVASIGFKTKLMPVKTTQDNQRDVNGPFIIYGFEGIVYAADNGAKIINTSWGGGGFSILGQEVINYALSKGALVVAAAGNDNSPENHYPSSYDGVLSVASTTSTDARSSFSNYGKTIDVSAPGSNILGTWQNDTFITISGTSMASPLAAGLAALVAAQFPNYSPLQIGEQVRVNSDDISTQNPGFINQLGFGRINAQKSLVNANSVSVRGTEFTYSDEIPGGDGDGVFEPGETISLGVKFINYLSPTSALSIQLQSTNSNAAIVNGNFNAGSVSTLQEFNNNSSKFTFTISNSAPQNAEVLFLVKFNDGVYNDFQWTKTIANPTFATQSGNDLAMTITSKGTFGFNDYSTNTQGDGIKYLGGSNLAFEGALILGTSPSKISDAARGADGSFQNNDFSIAQPFILNIPGNISDVQGSSIFNDNNAGTSKIGVTGYLNSYSYSTEPYNKFIILDYRFVNTSGASISNFYAGLFFDWDMIDGSGAGDLVTWDSSLNYGYARNTTGGPTNYVGAALLSAQNFGFYPIKNDGTDGGFSIYDGFSDAEKWLALTNGTTKVTAGPFDISHVISSGPYNIAANDTIRIAFAVLANDDKAGIDNAVINARNKFQGILTDVQEDGLIVPSLFALEQNYPNPFNPTTTIDFSIAKTGQVKLKLFDVLGKEVVLLIDGEMSGGAHSISFDASPLPSGVYFYTLISESNEATKKMVLLK